MYTVFNSYYCTSVYSVRLNNNLTSNDMYYFTREYYIISSTETAKRLLLISYYSNTVDKNVRRSTDVHETKTAINAV